METEKETNTSKSSNELISIIIISYNRPVETIASIRNVLLELDELPGFEKELIVINNGSTVDYSDVVSYIKDNNLVLNYVDNPENLGVSAGRNLGITHAHGRYVIFMDDDAVFQKTNVLAEVHDKFTKDPDAGIIGFGVYNFFTGEQDHPVKDQKKLSENEFYNNIFWGCGFVVRKAVFDQIGPFDGRFFYGMEEYDLCYRAMDKGHKVLFTKDIAVLHKVSTSGRERNTAKFSRMFINKNLIAYRYLGGYYRFTHFFMWSAFLIIRSGFNLVNYFRAVKKLREAIKGDKRTPISKETVNYIKSVSGRLTY
jgi:GT2 family glycosyltransferase